MIYVIKFLNFYLRINKILFDRNSKNGPLLSIILTQLCDVVFIDPFP